MPGVDDSIVGSLCDPARPTFLFGCTPPSEVTSEQEAIDVARKFADRGRVLAVDGYIVYDVQDESSRTDAKRPFPYRRLMEPSRYARHLALHHRFQEADAAWDEAAGALHECAVPTRAESQADQSHGC